MGVSSERKRSEESSFGCGASGVALWQCVAAMTRIASFNARGRSAKSALTPLA